MHRYLQQNSGTHFIDDVIIAKEAKFINTMDTAGMAVAESSRLVETARVTEANRVAQAQAAVQAAARTQEAARVAEAARVKADADAAKAKADAEAKIKEDNEKTLANKIKILSDITKELKTLENSKGKISADDYLVLYSKLSDAQKSLNAANDFDKIKESLSSANSITSSFADVLNKATQSQTAKLSASAYSLIEEIPEDSAREEDPFANPRGEGVGEQGAGKSEFIGDHHNQFQNHFEL